VLTARRLPAIQVKHEAKIKLLTDEASGNLRTQDASKPSVSLGFCRIYEFWLMSFIIVKMAQLRLTRKWPTAEAVNCLCSTAELADRLAMLQVNKENNISCIVAYALMPS
jgi:hypothetical protein